MVDGVIYTINEEDLSQEILREFCTKEHEDDVICVIQKCGNKLYINGEDIKNQQIDENC